MKFPKKYKEQLSFYESLGFHVKKIVPAKGCHMKVVFEEFDAPQSLTYHLGDPRAMRNNVAKFKRLAAEAKQGNK